MKYVGSAEQNELLTSHLKNWTKKGADLGSIQGKLESTLRDASVAFSGKLDAILKMPVPEHYGKQPFECAKPKTKKSEMRARAKFYVDEVTLNGGVLINLANPMGTVIDYDSVTQALVNNGGDIESIPFVAVPRDSLSQVRSSAHGYSPIEMRRAKYFIDTMGDLPKTIVKEPKIPVLKSTLTPEDAAKICVDRPFVLATVEKRLASPNIGAGERSMLEAYKTVLSSEKTTKPLHGFSSGIGIESNSAEPSVQSALDEAFKNQRIEIATLASPGLSLSVSKINRTVFENAVTWYKKHGGEMFDNSEEVRNRQVNGERSLNMFLAENNGHFGYKAKSMVGSVINNPGSLSKSGASALCTGFNMTNHQGRAAIEYSTEIVNGKQDGDLTMRYFPTMDMYQAERTLGNGRTITSMAKSTPKEAWVDAENALANKLEEPSVRVSPKAMAAQELNPNSSFKR